MSLGPLIGIQEQYVAQKFFDKMLTVSGVCSMNFRRLANISEQLFVSGIPTPPSTDISTIYNGFSYPSVDYEPYHGVDIVFPSLTSAIAIGLWGNISRLGFSHCCDRGC
jgi:hypothetical protein